MKICIIAAKEDKNARYLYEEFRKKDFSKVFLIDVAKLNVRISNKRVNVYYNKTKLKWDIYLLRMGVRKTPFSYLMAETLEKKAIVYPSSRTILNISDRGLLSKAILESKSFPQPITYVAFSEEATRKVAMKFEKIALKFGEQGGKGVVIVDKPSTGFDLLSIFADAGKPFCIQKFIEGEIIKTLVVGEEVIGIKEYVPIGEERSNTGKKEYMRLNEEVKSDLLKLANHLNTSLFEVDLIKRGKRYFAIDISLNPDLKMYTDLSSKNVGAIFANYILQKHSAKQI